MAEEKMARWHQGLNGHEFEQAQGDGRTGKPGMLQFMGMPKSQTRLSDPTTLVLQFVNPFTY